MQVITLYCHNNHIRYPEDIHECEVNACLLIGSVQIIEIKENDGPPVVGQTFSLICNVSWLNTSDEITWSRGGDITRMGDTLTFQPLRLSDAGQYTCEVSSMVQAKAYHNLLITSKLILITQSHSVQIFFLHYSSTSIFSRSHQQ